MVLKFAVVSDIHYGSEDYADVASSSALNRLKELIYELKEERVDFAVNLGDATSATTSIGMAKAVSDLLAGSGIKFFSILGNSETRDLGKDVATGLFDLPSRYYSLDFHGFRLMFLDTTFRTSTPKGYSSYVDEEQLEWIRNEILEPAIVFSHVPPYPFDLSRSPSSKEGLAKGTVIGHVSNWKQVLDAVSGQTLVLISGHLHETMFGFHRGIPIASIQGFSTIRNGYPTNSYAIVEIRKDVKISVEGREKSFFQFTPFQLLPE